MSGQTHTAEAEDRRQAIVDAALTLLDEDGVEKLSLRRLATQLGMHAPGLYWYIESKQDLIDLVARAIIERGLAQLETPAAGEPWQKWLVDLACATRSALLAHRDGARVVGGSYLMRGGSLTPSIETSLEILEAAGFDRLIALGATMTLIRYAIGSALAEQLSPITKVHEPMFRDEVLMQLMEAIPAEKWPRTADAYRRLFASDDRDRTGAGDRDRVFRWGAETFVRGFATSPDIPKR
jgi:TetR/AcrR family tetracycline transcriptional repressor